MYVVQAKNVKLHFPVDFVTADKFAENAGVGAATVEEGIPEVPAHLHTAMHQGTCTITSGDLYLTT